MEDDIKPVGLHELIEKRKEEITNRLTKDGTQPLNAKPISHRLRAAIHMAAMGLSEQQMSDSLGLTKARLRQLLDSTSARREIERLQNELYLKEASKAFANLVPKAIRATNRLLSPKAKEASQLGAAKEVFDRFYGKATQTIEHKGSAMKDLLTALDQRNRSETASPGTMDAEYREIPVPKEPKDEMDSLLDEIL